MYIRESEISCGVQELVDVGRRPSLKNYQDALSDEHEDNGLGCFLLASVPYNWKNSVKFLKSVGFKSNGARKNPNTGNKIILLSKAITAKERQSFGNRCIGGCGEIIKTRSRLCKYCS